MAAVQHLFGVCRTSGEHEHVRERLPGEIVRRAQSDRGRQVLDAAVVLLVGAVREAKQSPWFGAVGIPFDGRRRAGDRGPQVGSPECRGALPHVVVLQRSVALAGRGRAEFGDGLLEGAVGEPRKRLHVRGRRKERRDARRLPQQPCAHERRGRRAGRRWRRAANRTARRRTGAGRPWRPPRRRRQSTAAPDRRWRRGCGR